MLYSFQNPKSYRLNNIDATKIISQLSKKYNVKKFIFASSSSVYGDQKSFQLRRNLLKDQKFLCNYKIEV